MELSVLKVIKSLGCFTKGELMNVLNIDKKEIDDIIRELIELGYIYKLSEDRYCHEPYNDLSSLNEFLKKLDTKIRFNSVYFEQVSSTQSVARQLAEEGAFEGTIVVAETQSAGKGRYNRKWFSPKGGIWMTVILRPNLSPSMIPIMGLMMGVVVTEAINKEYKVHALVKWPNDVLIGCKKVCGILIEGSVQGSSLEYILVGIGINANNKLPSDVMGISLREIIGKSVLRIPLIITLCRILDRYYSLLVNNPSQEVVDKILAKWKALSHTLGRKVRVTLCSGRDVIGKAVDVDSLGNLLLLINERKLKVAYHEVVKLAYLD
ncbi:MAG: biotin--[acetyl-CoA-carboxylase] ligase [Thermoprotei archaeon]|nr:MAG: biotin--[acetyl-CoA-carboxylase] ligase [Thermoprotei archaeon]